MRGILGPPPEPVMPGGYDFARMSYYQGIGASGYSLSKPELPEGRGLPVDMKPRTWLADLRARIGARITAVLLGQTGEIAAALTVGQTAGLDERSMDDLRGSGLAHVISISGLHMSLVAGTVFWFLRWTLALFPSIALRYSVRALAGGAALVCVTIYLALSGASIAAVRSYLMSPYAWLILLIFKLLSAFSDFGVRILCQRPSPAALAPAWRERSGEVGSRVKNYRPSQPWECPYLA
jgi:competence protein ComEC